MSDRFLAAALLALLLAAGPAFGDALRELGDPTRPPGAGTRVAVAEDAAERNESGLLRVSTVLISEDLRFAVIGGRRVLEGDVVAGAIVLEIDLSAVHLEGSNGEFALLVAGRSIKTPVGGE